MTPKRSLYWSLSCLIWLLSAGLVYLGLVLILLAPLFGPRGNIDYLDFSAQEKRSANIQTALTRAAGFIPLVIAYSAITRRKRLLVRFLQTK